jgi:predicted SAM-dependent methyltransferase
MNINIGGCKGFKKYSEEVRKQWHTMDSHSGADVQYDLNCKTPMPLKDNSVDNYYCSHTLEHVKPENVLYALQEMKRTLKPGGKLRIIVPDIRIGIKKYMENNIKGSKPYRPDHFPKTSLGCLMAWFYTDKLKHANGHEMVFDKETLYYYLEQAGFTKITLLGYTKHSLAFQDKDFEKYAGWSIYVEVEK